jgi:hypothetical protein
MGADSEDQEIGTEGVEHDTELEALMKQLNGDSPEIDPTFRENLLANLVRALREQQEEEAED